MQILHKFDSNIVQLQYKHRVLLVSTLERTFLISTDQDNATIDIGTKPIRRYFKVVV